MIRNGNRNSPVGRLALTSLALAAIATPALLNAAFAQAQDTGRAVIPNIRGTLITGDEMEFDFGTKQYVLTGDVKLRSAGKNLDAAKMTVQLTAARELEWAKCDGGVYLEQKNPQDGTQMTGKGRTLEYYEKKQLAYLKGGIFVTQSSPRLVKPLEVTGDHIDMNLQTKVNVVHGGDGSSKQAKVHVEPKGNPPAAGAAQKTETPEPVDLIGDQIQMNSETQEYVSNGNPQMVRPSSNLRAKTIRFQVDQTSNEVKNAYADDNVIFDGKSSQGSVVHATGDKGVYAKATNEVTLTGTVHATVKDPDQDEPSVYQGNRFLYNTQSGSYKLSRDPQGPQASVVLPQRPTPAEKPGDKPGEKPAKPAAPVTPADVKKPGR